MLVAVRCAAGQSWINPVERVMSLLNLGLQNVALERPPSEVDKVEALLKKCGSMSAIRRAAAKQKEKAEAGDPDAVEDLKEAWLDCVEPLKNMIRGRFERLSLKGKQVTTQNPVTDDQIEALQTFVSQIDESIDFAKMQKRFVDKCNKYQAWIAAHTQSRTYTYQIRKCDDPECCTRKQLDTPLDWLPDPVLDSRGEHYKPFASVFRKVTTTDDDRPSNRPFAGKVSEDDQGCKTSLLTGQTARRVAVCNECNKPRVVYALEPKKVTDRDLLDLDVCIREYDYTCGSHLLPSSHPLYKKVVVRLGMTCANPVEFPFYSTKVPIGPADTCAHCGGRGGERPQADVMTHKCVLPICDSCKGAGKTAIKKMPRPAAAGTS